MKKRPRLDVKTLRWVANMLRAWEYPKAYTYQTPTPQRCAHRISLIAAAEERRQLKARALWA